MTREQAEAQLAEDGMEFVDITIGGKLDRVLVVRSIWRERRARSLTPYTVASGPTWQWAFAEATGEAPF